MACGEMEAEAARRGAFLSTGAGGGEEDEAEASRHCEGFFFPEALGGGIERTGVEQNDADTRTRHVEAPDSRTVTGALSAHGF